MKNSQDITREDIHSGISNLRNDSKWSDVLDFRFCNNRTRLVPPLVQIQRIHNAGLHTLIKGPHNSHMAIGSGQSYQMRYLDNGLQLSPLWEVKKSFQGDDTGRDTKEFDLLVQGRYTGSAPKKYIVTLLDGEVAVVEDEVTGPVVPDINPVIEWEDDVNCDLDTGVASAGAYELSPDGNYLLVAANNTLHEFSVTNNGDPVAGITSNGSVDLFPLGLANAGITCMRYLNGGTKLMVSSFGGGVKIINLTTAQRIIPGFGSNTTWDLTDHYTPSGGLTIYGFSVNESGNKFAMAFRDGTTPKIIAFDIPGSTGNPDDVTNPTIIATGASAAGNIGFTDAYFITDNSILAPSTIHASSDEMYVYDVSAGIDNATLDSSGDLSGNPGGVNFGNIHVTYFPVTKRFKISGPVSIGYCYKNVVSEIV